MKGIFENCKKASEVRANLIKVNNVKCGIVIGKERMDALISGGENAMDTFWTIL